MGATTLCRLSYKYWCAQTRRHMPHSHLGARLPDTDRAGVLSTWETEVYESRWPPKGGVSRPVEADRSEGRKGRKVPGVEYPEGSCLEGAFFS